MVCNHLCRCILLLLFRQEYAAALACVQVCAAIGESPSANDASGRYIAFFLGYLAQRLQQQQETMEDLEKDEEMIAYMSGDMQGSADSSWVWQDHHHNNNSDVDEISPPPPPSGSGMWMLPEQEEDSWPGWQYVERTIESLLAGKEYRQQQQLLMKSSSNYHVDVQPSTPAATTSAVAATGGSSNSASAQSRMMTIANII